MSEADRKKVSESGLSNFNGIVHRLGPLDMTPPGRSTALTASLPGPEDLQFAYDVVAPQSAPETTGGDPTAAQSASQNAKAKRTY